MHRDATLVPYKALGLIATVRALMYITFPGNDRKFNPAAMRVVAEARQRQVSTYHLEGRLYNE
jgi:hypothetical protein